MNEGHWEIKMGCEACSFNEFEGDRPESCSSCEHVDYHMDTPEGYPICCEEKCPLKIEADK